VLQVFRISAFALVTKLMRLSDFEGMVEESWRSENQEAAGNIF
jgi:hypothetical protein